MPTMKVKENVDDEGQRRRLTKLMMINEEDVAVQQ
jgi:hypothetical protein